MRKLLGDGVTDGVECINHSCDSCLFVAASLGHVGAVTLLSDYGADSERNVAVRLGSKTYKACDFFRDCVDGEGRRRIREMLP